MIKKNRNKRAASLAISAALLASCVPAGAYAADQTADDVLYGTASMTYLQYWEGENIASKTKTEAKGTTRDSEGTDDLGAFDAVSRATTKHGIFRHGFQFITTVKGVADDGAGAAVSVKQDAVVGQKDGRATLTAKARKDAAADEVVLEDMAETFERDGKTYTIEDYSVQGFQRIPVAIDKKLYEQAMELKASGKKTALTEAVNHITIGGTDGTGQIVTAATGGIKKLKADGTYGPASEGIPAKGNLAVDKVEYAYNTKYGDYADAYVYLKHNDGSNVTSEEFLEYAASYLTAEYAYYGKTNPERDSDAKPIAVYGTKNAADTWWSANHGVRIDAGFNFDSLRLGGSGADTSFDGIYNKGAAADKLGYWKVTYKAAGYNDVSAVVYLKDQYKAPQIKISGNALVLSNVDSKLKNVLTAKDTIVTLEQQEGEGRQAKWVKIADMPNSAKGRYSLQPYNLTKGAAYRVTIETADYASVSQVFEYTSVKLNKTKTVLYKNKATQLKTDIEGAVTWKSSNPAVASVNEKGLVTAKKAGTAVITATASEGKASAACTITVKNPELKLAKSSAVIKKGKTVTIKATAVPTIKIVYKSNNKKVAAVSSQGVVKGKKKGKAKITVTANGVKKTFTVIVK